MKKKLINGTLLLVVVILWSWIGVDVGKSVISADSEKNANSQIPDTLDLGAFHRFVYTSSYRDIFAKQEPSQRNKPPLIQQKAESLRSKFSLTLLGVIGDNQNPIALVEHQGVTQYLSVGDSTALGRIKSIAPDSIVVSPLRGNPETLYLKR